MKFKILFHRLYKHYFISYFLLLGGIVMVLLAFGTTILSEAKYYYEQAFGKHYVLDEVDTPKQISEEDSLLNPFDRTLHLVPANKDFSIVIEKIGVSAPIIANVSTNNESEYFEAMKHGVAHAAGKALPGEPGNIYLFAHSSIEFWKMGPYATVFNQLRRLERNDTIYIFYKDKKYEYKVFKSSVVSGFNTAPLVKDYKVGSILTLQTCDPPGTTLNRLIVEAYEVK